MLAPDRHDVLQCGVQTIGKTEAHAVTAEKTRGISSYGWAFDSRTIIYAQDAAGDENFHIFAVSLDTNNIRDLTHGLACAPNSVASNPKFPEQILVALNLAIVKRWTCTNRSRDGRRRPRYENPGDGRPMARR